MNKQHFSLIHVSVFVAAIFVSGCDGKWEKMPDEELAAKSTDCYKDNLSSAMIQVCKNYERECARRREQGNYVC